MVSFQRAFLLLASSLSLEAIASHSNPCCEALRSNLEGKVIINPDGTGFRDDNWSKTKGSYWSNQAKDVSPDCFVLPANAGDVSVALQLLTLPPYTNDPKCKFAIRSGGQTAWADAANIKGGVTIDLSNMKEVTISKDNTSVSLEPGNRWGRVYRKLDEADLSITGARWGDVGVGGFLNGGGLSFFQGSYGLACDSIINHEVVLANGTIINANEQENSDLHKALKGGSNNFGVITRFYLNTFPQREIWGGLVVPNNRNDASLADWFQNFANSSSSAWDPNGMTMFTLGSLTGTITAGGTLATYSQPQIDVPDIFKPFWDTSIKASTKREKVEKVAESNSALAPSGGRTLWATTTFINSAVFMEAIMKLAVDKSKETPNLLSGIQLMFEPLWQQSRAKAFQSSGGNVLGLEDSSDDLVVVLATATWSFVESDHFVDSVMRQFIEQAEQLSRKMGVWHRFIHANYAAGWQDPMASYGEASWTFLKEVSHKYDPNGVFQKQVPGGFKLERTDVIGRRLTTRTRLRGPF